MWGEVEAILDEALASRLFAGCALCVNTKQGQTLNVAIGKAEIRPNRREANLNTVWDLASLTKVLATTPLMMRLVGGGQIKLDTPIREWLPWVHPQITARHCLSHTSGLPNWKPFFETFSDQQQWGTPQVRQAVFRAAGMSVLSETPGQNHTYSDLGFMVLGDLIETIHGDRLDMIWQREIGRYCEGQLLWGCSDAAATEDCPVRGRVLVGEVHDLNAAVLGGVAPHAGLFASAQDVAKAADWQLASWNGDASRGLKPEVVREFWAYVGQGSHRLGWDSPSVTASSASSRWPLEGVGHLGFTGGSLWIAPRQGVTVALCSNRVHPEVEGGARPGAEGPKTAQFRRFRPRLFEAVVTACDASGLW